MNDSKGLSFSSPELQSAVADAQPILEGVEEARNRVSNDIKALEAYLQGTDVKVPFRHSLGKSFVPEDQQNVQASIELNGSASGSIEEDALVWMDDGTGRFRLHYEVSRWDGYVDVDIPGGPLFWDESRVQREAKPLIESKFEIRKAMYRHLADFVASLARYLDIEDRKPASSDGDIPF